MDNILGIIILAVVAFLLIVIIRGLKIVPQAHVFVIEHFGSFKCEWQTGIHFLVPFVDRIAGKVSLKEKVVDFKPQPVITKDNVTMQIDTVVFYQVTDAKQYIYGVERPLAAIENLSATTLRNIIGEMELDATLTSRDVIKAERERREKILQAEGDKKSQVLVAEGEKESQILRAEAKKEAQILEAEAQKQAMILRADAVREQKILEATGEAKAIEMVQAALADSLVKLNSANPTEKVIQLKSLEAFAKAADGKATKIIIPSEIQSVAGLAAGLKSVIENDSAPQQK